MVTAQASAINPLSFLFVLVATIVSVVMRSLSSLSYEACGMASPLGVRVHSTRSVASSRALARGASWQDVYGPLCTHSSGSTVSGPSGLIQPASTHNCLCRNIALWAVQWCGVPIASSHVLSSPQKGTSQVTGLFHITCLCSS